MNSVLKLGLCCGLFLAGRWTSSYELDIKKSDQEEIRAINTPGAGVLPETDEPKLTPAPKGDEIAVKKPRRKLIKMAPGYVYDAENQVMVKIPSKLAEKRVRPIYARGN